MYLRTFRFSDYPLANTRISNDRKQYSPSRIFTNLVLLSALTTVLQTIKWSNYFCYLRVHIVSVLHKTQQRGKLSVTDPSPYSNPFKHRQQVTRNWMIRSQTEPYKEHYLCSKLAASCCSFCLHLTSNKMLMSKNIPNCPDKVITTSRNSFLIQDMKKKKRQEKELVRGCLKRRK